MRSTTLPVSAVPLTFSAWARGLNVTANHHIVNISDEATSWDGFSLALAGASGGDPAQAVVGAANVYSIASSSVSYREQQWAHYCAVFTSATSRDIYINGALLGSETTSRTPSGVTAVNIARYVANVYYEHAALDVGPVAIYSAALGPAAVRLLARGDDPRTISLGSLEAIWPMEGRGGDEIDLVSGQVLTAVNAPGVAARPPGLWRLHEDRRARIYSFAAEPAAGGAFKASWAIAARGQIHGAGRGH